MWKRLLFSGDHRVVGPHSIPVRVELSAPACVMLSKGRVQKLTRFAVRIVLALAIFAGGVPIVGADSVQTPQKTAQGCPMPCCAGKTSQPVKASCGCCKSEQGRQDLSDKESDCGCLSDSTTPDPQQFSLPSQNHKLDLSLPGAVEATPIPGRPSEPSAGKQVRSPRIRAPDTPGHPLRAPPVR